MKVLTDYIKRKRQQIKSYTSFRQSLRSAIRGYWDGSLTEFQFVDNMSLTIEKRLNEAFDNIAKEYGVNKDEYTSEEKSWISNFVNTQITYIPDLSFDIASNTKESGGNLEPLISRADMWANRYEQVESQARVFFAGDGKLEWQLGPSEKSCVSCNNLNGKVKRASFWKKMEKQGIHPKSPFLKCQGYRCKCKLVDTTNPVSPGPLPSI